MSFGQQIIIEIENVLHKVITEYNRLRVDLSQIDTLEQTILHELEFSNFNVVQGYTYAKKLKEVREKRRIIKNEYESVQALYSFANKNLNDVKIISNRLNKKRKNNINDEEINSSITSAHYAEVISIIPTAKGKPC